MAERSARVALAAVLSGASVAAAHSPAPHQGDLAPSAVNVGDDGSSAPGQAAATQGSPANAPPGLDARAFDDVVVTARKRPEIAQTVPLAMTVLDQGALDRLNIADFADLSSVTPSLFVQPSTFRQDTINIDMRGQQNFQSTDLSFDTSVAVYVNGVYYARPVGLTGALFDTDSLEILEGPQGTLVGRNATGGAVLYTNKEPVRQFGGELKITGGDFGHDDVQVVLNLPLSPILWFRGALDTAETAGYIKNDFYNPQTGLANTTPGEGTRKVAGVFSLRYQPDDTLHVTLRGSFDAEHDTGSSYHDLGYFVGTTLAAGGKPSICNIPGTCTGFKDLIGQTITPFYANYLTGSAPSSALSAYNALLNSVAREQGEGFWSTEQAISNYDIGHFQVISASAEKVLGRVNIKLTGAYRWFDAAGDAVSRGLPYVTSVYIYDTPHYRSYQSELTVNGADFDNRLKWTAGGFYFRETSPDDGDQDFLFLPSAATPAAASGRQITYTNPTADSQENASYAAYGQGTVTLTAKTRLTLGVRYTEDVREAQLAPQTELFPANPATTLAVSNGVYNPAPVTLFGLTYPGQTDACSLTNAAGALLPQSKCFLALEKTYHKPTWTVSLDHDLFGGALIYVTTRSGYRSGGINAAAVSPGAFTAKPEDIQDYEIGLKADLRLLTMPVRANIDAYYSDYSNIQISATLPNVTVASAAGGGPCTQTAYDAGQCLDTTKDTVTLNAKSAHIKGFEYQLSVKPIPALTVSASGSYLDAVYTNFSYTPPPGYLLPTGTNNFTGTHFPLPTWQINNTVNYALPVHSLFSIPFREVSLSWHGYLQSRNEASLTGYNPAQLAKGYALSNFRLDVTDLDRRGVDVSAFVTNAFNKAACEAEPQGVLNSAPNATFGAAGSSGVLQCVPMPPRMYGLRFDYRF